MLRRIGPAAARRAAPRRDAPRSAAVGRAATGAVNAGRVDAVDGGEQESRVTSEPPPRRRLVSGASMAAPASALFIGVVLAVLLIAGRDSFLLFHVLAELFFVFVAVSIFIVAWVLREFLDDDFGLFLGVALVAVASLRVAHMLDFAGMSVLDTPDPDQATQLWVAAALVLAVSLVIAPFLLGRRMPFVPVVGLYVLVDGLVLAAIYWWDVFPRAYGVNGLTGFKKIAEYVVCAILILAIVSLLRRRSLLRPAAVPLLVAAYTLTVAAELLFTDYFSVQSWTLRVGHLVAVLAAYLVYKAVAEAGLARPLALEVDNLRLSERAAQAERERAEEVSRDFDELLELTPTFHVDVGYAETAQAVCRGARRMFACQSATLFETDGYDIVVEAREPRATLMHSGVRFNIAADTELRRLVKSRAPSFLADAGEHPLLPLGVDRRISARAESALRVPIGVGPTADKVLVLTWGEAHPAPDQMLLALVQRFADHAGAALSLAARRDLQAETRRLYERLESSLMPVQSVDHAEITVSTRYQAGARGLRIGGDFVGVLDHPDGRISVVSGDVSGHGPDAAALGATLRGSWRALALADVGWQSMLETLAGVLVRERHEAEDFVTLFAVTVASDGRSAEIVNVAHPPALLVSGGVAPVEVRPSPPLGAFDDGDWRPFVLPLPDAPWQLVLYTDGLTEARVAPETRERLGIEGLITIVSGRLRDGLLDEEGIDGMLTDVEAGAGEPLGDDVAIIVVTSPHGHGGRLD
jgi:serine phosphatase RsbU (regulator of sigma subunit)